MTRTQVIDILNCYSGQKQRRITRMTEELTTLEKVRNVIIERFGVEIDEVTEDTKIFDLCNDIPDWYNVLVDCEDDFRIGDISDDDIEGATATVKQLVDLINQKLAIKLPE